MSTSSASTVCSLDDELVSIVSALRERFPDDEYLMQNFSMKFCVLENYGDQVLDKSTTAR